MTMEKYGGLLFVLRSASRNVRIIIMLRAAVPVLSNSMAVADSRPSEAGMQLST